MTRIAHESARNPAEVLANIVSSALELDCDQELWASVANSDAEFARGESVPHEQVVQETHAIIDRARARRR